MSGINHLSSESPRGLLADWGLAEEALAVAPSSSTPQPPGILASIPPASSVAEPSPRPLELEVRRLGGAKAKFRADADPDNNADLRNLLVGAIRRSGGDLSNIGHYELVVHLAGSADPMTTFVAPR